jgi:hypothetical protein
MDDISLQTSSESRESSDNFALSPSRGFRQTYQQYVQTLTSLRSFASELNPAVQESARKAGALVEEGVTILLGALGASPDEIEQLRKSKEARERFLAEREVERANKFDPKTLRAALLSFVRVTNHAKKYFPHQQIMRGSVLLSLVGAFEVLLSDLVRLFFERHQTALESEEKSHSLKEVFSFKSMDDFIGHVIEQKVDAFLRGSVADWVKFFQQKRIDMSKFVPSWENFVECFQRRHVIVHNGGRVDRKYLDSVGQEWIERHKEEVQLGEVLIVGDEYLSLAFDYFELAGSLLCQECWKRFARDDRDVRSRALCDHQYECLLEKKWVVAETLGSWCVSEGDMTSSDTLMARINRWLSIKRQGRWSEIETEVMGFDYSVLNLRYVAAIHALAGRTDLFFSVLPKAQISEEELKDWPILDEMRDDPRFKECLDKV